jgi:hypothetical protein
MNGGSARGVRIIGSWRYMIVSSGDHRRTCPLPNWLKCNVFQPPIAMAQWDYWKLRAGGDEIVHR